MRRFITTIFGLFSAVAGVLFIAKDEYEPLRPVQIITNELSWFAALLGSIAVIWAVFGKPRLWFGLLTGAFGTAVALKPYLDFRATMDDTTSAMRVGLGRAYETEIPAVVRSRLLPDPLSVSQLLGAHLRQSRARVWRDVTYAQPHGIPLKLDVYEPMGKPAVGDMYPAIITIHGGGWQNGDKQEYFEATHRYLANLGYVVFDIQYRLSGTAKWPAQLEDLQSAIRWVRDHAVEYRVDSKQIALLGRSAGAHMALMAAMRADQATQVQAVIAFYAPAEMKFEGLTSASSIFNLLGGRFEDLRQEYIDASPVDWVRDDLPPILFVEARRDTITPSFHGEKLSKGLSKTNTPFVHLQLPWARHGFDAVTFGLGSQLVQYHVDRFLAHTFYAEQA